MSEPRERPGDVFERLVEARRAGRRVVLVTVVSVEGSAPRQPGARMLVEEDGTTHGTVGGGVREAEIVEAALGLHRTGETRRLGVDFSSGEGGGDGPICGGRMEVFMERIEPVRRILIAGAGHVGFYVHRIALLLEMQTLVLDPRDAWASEERFPGAERVAGGFDARLTDLGLGPADAIVIVTPEHAHDELVLRSALATEAGYVGMIGSRRKVAAVLRRLEDDGVDAAAIARVRAPVGLDIGAETPAEIAVAILGEVVLLARGPSGKGRSIPPQIQDEA